MKLSAILFDIDGTMADTLPVCVSSIQKTLKVIDGKDYTEPEITRYFGIAEGGIFARMVLPDRHSEAMSVYYKTYAELHVQYCQLFPGLKTILNEIHAHGLKMGVVTGRGAKGALLSLELLGVLPYFDVVEHGSDEVMGKKEPLQRALAALEVDPAETLYVGDTEGDMRDSTGLGMWAAGAAWATTATLHPNGWGPQAEIFTSVENFRNWLLPRIASS
ncbi:MAG: hypothetical protein CVU39_00355 [Chloroflexi bacterium HGW-Chloroflexi-10]|nr:MAG: hypothetical protein CVU39_00355 [Chloroflexi bacterium HGW-Chloroflexi-10]